MTQKPILKIQNLCKYFPIVSKGLRAHVVGWVVLGEVCTALVGMRGATFVNDFLTGVQAWRANSVK